MTPPNLDSTYRVSVKALILDETKKKFLVGLSENGKWLLLGGGLEHGETVEQCLSREFKEEAGLEVVTLNPSPAYILPGKRDDGAWAIEMIHEVIVKDLNITPSRECTKVMFVSAQEVKELITFQALQRFAEVFDTSMHRRFTKDKLDI